MDDAPPEEDVWPDDNFDTFEAELLLLITRNKMGRDPTAEARYSGNVSSAQWLDAVVSRLDHAGTRRTEANVAEMIEYVKGDRFHNFMSERALDTKN